MPMTIPVGMTNDAARAQEEIITNYIEISISSS